MYSERVRAWHAARYADSMLAYNALMLCYPFTLEDLDVEIWAWISGYEGDYQESTFGRTKSFKRGKVKIMKPSLDSNGYLFVELHKNDGGKKFKVHQLVAQTFIPNPKNLPEVDHKFGMRLDNSVGNLQWVTRAENNTLAFALSLYNHPKGEGHHNALMTNAQAEYCRKVHIKGDKEFGSAALARKFAVNPSTIIQIVRGKSYKNVK